MASALIDVLRKDADEFALLRRFIHQHPELGHEEHETSALVARRLIAMGYHVASNIGGTGVVATLTKGTSKRSIGLRADMDALPIQEIPGRDHASIHSNKMHACGHDGHTATLLLAAKYLAEQAVFDGTVNLIFQPAEETLSGARGMIEDGLFDRFPCDAVFAMHNAPGLPLGMALCNPGRAGASSDAVTIEITGQGGHGSAPHMTRDVTVALAALIQSLQTIVSRNSDPTKTAVLSIGSIRAGDTFNVIPEFAKLQANVRASEPEVRDLVGRRIREIAAGIAEAYRVTIDVKIAHLISALVNDDKVTAEVSKVLEDLLGSNNVVRYPPLGGLGSDDFSSMAEVKPSCYISLGNGTGSHGGCTVHNPGYDFNDELLPIGAAYWVSITQHWLAPAAENDGVRHDL